MAMSPIATNVILSTVFCCLPVLVRVWGESQVASVVRDEESGYHVVSGRHPDSVVTASFKNEINITGWSFLEVLNVAEAPDQDVAYFAGLLEGKLTGSLMYQQWQNTMAGFCSTPSPFCSRLEQFLKSNTDYMLKQIEDKGNSSAYWYQVSLFFDQLRGLQDGYNQAGQDPLPDSAFYYFQLHGDLDTLTAALGGGNNTHHHVPGAGSCSALVQVLPGNSDLLVGHDTWTSYYNMIRIFKLYDLKLHTSPSNQSTIPGHRQSFSSYPGRLYSGDDFYMISSGLLSMETTIGNTNPERWKYVTPQSVPENFRVVVANRLATSGEQWTDIFRQENSGTYNNEWMIVDYKLFQSGQQTLPDGILWVLEQIPGMVEAKDLTHVLRAQSYWPSYNIPYYPDIFNQSGFPELVKKYGSWFSWSGSPRAHIFARNHSLVTDMDSMIKLMRYNNFQHDPLSRCNCTPPYSGENAISARSDLNLANGTYPFSALTRRCHGGIDVKVTSSQLMPTLSCMAASGPTHDQQPVFQWSTSGFQPKPLGHPDKWDFGPVSVQWTDTTHYT